MRRSKIFQPSNDIPPIHVHPRAKKPDAPEGTLKNHHNKGAHEGTMDDVSRHNHPDAHHLDTEIMGND
jgi:hypothetical protein